VDGHVQTMNRHASQHGLDVAIFAKLGRKKIAFFKKTNVMILSSAKIAVIGVKIATFSSIFLANKKSLF
jgi:hypothetical protein